MLMSKFVSLLGFLAASRVLSDDGQHCPTDNNYTCNFAPDYDVETLFNSSEIQDEFLQKFSYWEGHYLTDKLGTKFKSAISCVSLGIDMTTGLASNNNGQCYTVVEAEGLHLSLLALALDGNKYAITAISSSIPSFWNASMEGYVLDQLRKKISVYENFTRLYPGFGGFLPEDIMATDSGISLNDNNYNTYIVMMSTNGAFVWGLVAVAEVLRNNSSNLTADFVDLSEKYSAYVEMLANNAIYMYCDKCSTAFGRSPVFFDGVLVSNINAHPAPNNYSPDDDYFLDTPWFGEHTFFFLYFYANWSGISQEKKDKLWEGKRQWMRSREFESDSGNITVLESWDNYIDETRHFFFLPYFKIDIVRRISLNVERARVHYATMNNMPGLSTNPQLPSYYTSHESNVISPLIAEFMFLHNVSRPYGTAWVATMLQGSQMQTNVGYMPQINVTGLHGPNDFGANFVKLYLLLGICGGIGDITSRYLERTGKYAEFRSRLEWLYNLTFADGITGDDVDFVLPNAKLPNVSPPFTGCTGKSTSATTPSFASSPTTSSFAPPTSKSTSPTTPSFTSLPTTSSFAPPTSESTSPTTSSFISSPTTSSFAPPTSKSTGWRNDFGRFEMAVVFLFSIQFQFGFFK